MTLKPDATRGVIVAKKGRRIAFIPHFMLERSVRTALQNLYVAAIGSTSNADLEKIIPSNRIAGRGKLLEKGVQVLVFVAIYLFLFFPLLEHIQNASMTLFL